MNVNEKCKEQNIQWPHTTSKPIPAQLHSLLNIHGRAQEGHCGPEVLRGCGVGQLKVNVVPVRVLDELGVLLMHLIHHQVGNLSQTNTL